jgi:hypothetical protein
VNEYKKSDAMLHTVIAWGIQIYFQPSQSSWQTELCGWLPESSSPILSRPSSNLQSARRQVVRTRAWPREKIVSTNTGSPFQDDAVLHDFVGDCHMYLIIFNK